MSYPRALTRAVLCMLLSLMLLACEEGGKGAPGSSGPREVVIIKLEPRREVYTTALAGRIASFQVAEVRPQVGGILQQRLFTEGADVKAGQALYQIDPATYEAALDSAQAALMKAEANVTPARLKAERFRELLAIKAVSKQEYDDAQAAFKQAEADVAVNRAAVKTARINLEYTKVRSPISGRIGKSAFTPGALVTANQAQALTSVRQLDPVYVDITQSSQDLLRLRAQFTNGELRSAAEEAPVRLKLENGAMYPHEGRLQFTKAPAWCPCAPCSPIPNIFCCPACTCARSSPRAWTKTPCWSRSGRCGAIRRGRLPCSLWTAAARWTSGLSTWAVPWAIRGRCFPA